MKIRMLKTAALVLHLAVLVSLAHAQATSPKTEVSGKVDEYMSAYLAVNGIGGSVLLARDGKVIYQKGYGAANLETKQPNDPSLRYRIGSLTKQFTAAAILLLQERGKLSVSHSACRFLDRCPEPWKEITIHQLLSHGSGIPNVTAQAFWPQKKKEDLSTREVVELVQDLPLRFAPGSDFEYSNTNYIILGLIIEKISGSSYADFLNANVFTPLGMTDSGYDDGSPKGREFAAGYSKRGSDVVLADTINMKAPHAAGSLFSTVGDLYRWSEALSGTKLLSQESVDAMFTAHNRNYAYGWGVSARDARTSQSHAGGIDGFASYIVRFPTEKASVVVLLNNTNANVTAVGADLTRILFGESYELPRSRKEIELDAKILDSYIGEYRVAPGLSFTIARGANGLTFQPTGQPRAAEIFAETETAFFLKVVEAQIIFIKDDSGKIVWLEFKQAGRTTRAARQ